MASSPNSGTVDDNSSTGIPENSHENWWRYAPVVADEIRNSARSRLRRTALHGKQCLITGETGPSVAIETCHLVERSTRDNDIRRLQYAWGRKFHLDNRWNLFYLRVDIHRALDANLPWWPRWPRGRDPGWALVPEPDLVRRIRVKMEEEQVHRGLENIKGPWPDFRSENWFPTKKDGYNYIFVPLAMKDEDVMIARREYTPNSPPTIHLYFPPYQNFPRLKCHVHPYMVIRNAYPKLQYNDDIALPQEIDDMMDDLQFIYETWQKASGDAGGPPLPASGNNSRRSSRNGPRPPKPNRRPSRLSTHQDVEPHEDATSQGGLTQTGSPSGEQDRYDEVFDTSNGESSSIPSVFTSEDSIPCQADATGTPDPLPAYSFTYVNQKLAEVDQTARMPKDFNEWVLGVESAREHNQFVAVIDDTLGLRQYAAEEARTPSTDDWHSWTSEYAPWYVLLPKNRGRLSSNDWVEVKNYRPLTRALDLED